MRGRPPRRNTALHRPSARSSLLHLAVPILLAVALPGGVAAQAPAHDVDASVGAVVVAHGGSPDWNAPVLEAASRASKLLAAPVAVSFLMGDSAAAYRFQDAVGQVVDAGASRVVVIPLLASSHGSHFTQIRWLAGEI